MKLTGIELLQKIKDNEFSIYQKATSLDCTYRNCTIEFILDKSNLDEIMNLEFEVQTTEKAEENKEIEELNAYKLIEEPYMALLLRGNQFDEFMELLKQSELEIVEKIGELVRAVNKLIKESEEK